MGQNSQKTVLSFFLPQVLGHNGISRFNRNLIQAFDNGSSNNIHSLNDSENDKFRGYSRVKWKFYKYFILSVLKRPEFIFIGHLNFVPLTVISWLFGVKTIVILHGIEAWNVRKRNRLFLKFPYQYWAVSEYTKKIFEEQNQISTQKVSRIFNTLPSNWNSNHNITYETFFLSVSRLIKEEGYKGIDLTIKSLIPLKERLRSLGYKYIIVAHGDDLQRHKNLAVNNGLDDIIDFRSNLSDIELSSLYAQCSFFILPSTGEGFGIVFLEAMAYRKACIGAASCGAEDVIYHNETGLLINQNKHAISEAIKVFLNEPQMAIDYGEAGFQKLTKEFSFSNFKQHIHNLLTKCAE